MHTDFWHPHWNKHVSLQRGQGAVTVGAIFYNKVQVPKYRQQLLWWSVTCQCYQPVHSQPQSQGWRRWRPGAGSELGSSAWPVPSSAASCHGHPKVPNLQHLPQPVSNDSWPNDHWKKVQGCAARAVCVLGDIMEKSINWPKGSGWCFCHIDFWECWLLTFLYFPLRLLLQARRDVTDV